jgi:IS605 OrfB family transposase
VSGRGIVLEDLKGIRDRIAVRRIQRATFSAWSFHQLRSFVTYNAQEAGVLVLFVDPRNTSRTCPACGYVDPASRKSQSVFSCVKCEHSWLADHFAALEIQRRAAWKPATLLGQGLGACQGKAAPRVPTEGG